MPLESLQPTEYKESCVSFPVRAVKTSARCSHDTRQPPLMEGVWVSESPCGAWLSWGTLTCFGHSKSKSRHWSCKDTRILRCIYYSSGLSWVMQIEEALMWTGWITYPRPRGEQTVGPGFEITAIYPTAIYIISTLFWIPSEREPAQSPGSREERELLNKQATHIYRWLPWRWCARHPLGGTCSNKSPSSWGASDSDLSPCFPQK